MKKFITKSSLKIGVFFISKIGEFQFSFSEK